MALVAAGAVLIGCGCTKLPPQPEVQSEDRAPSWSPDGQWIAYVHFDSNPRDTLDVGGIYITNVAGTVKRLVIGSPSARSVDWSPDSRWLVFNDALGLHVIKADGESLRTIYSGGSFPSWSPDGREIAFSTTIQVWGIHPDGTGLHEITPAGPPYGGDAD